MAHSCIYNVEHGDYIAIKTDNDISIIRDCGSLDATTRGILPTFLPHTTSCYKETSLHEAMVTHPHEDHYLGFEQMRVQMKEGQPKFFDVAYVPILYLDSNEYDIKLLESKNYQLEDLSLTALAVKVALHLWTHLYEGSRAPNPTNWLKVAPLMADISNRLDGVYAGSTFFNHWEPQGTVLWPPHLGSAYYCKNRDKLRNLLSGGLFDSDDIDDDVTDVLKLIEDIKDDSQQVPYEDYLSRINSIISLIHRNDQKNDNTAKTIDQKANQFGEFIDDHSIVFSIGSEDNSVLFLSDLNEPAMNKMIDDMDKLKNSDQYTFIKSAHHGTRLSKKLFNRLNSQTKPIHTIVHSCGNGQGNSREPDALNQRYKYKNLKPTKKTINCTSWKTSSWTQPCPFNKFSSNYKCYTI